jgi:6-pyruvoyltetrahydropterin/6-carboxytetrahydropterin synthase
MYKVEIRIRFRAAHRLIAPYEGKCSHPHGEAYTLIVIVGNKLLDKNGMVVDFGVLKKEIREWVDENLDHTYIYQIGDEVGDYLKGKGFRTYGLNFNPTAENLAKYMYSIIGSITKERFDYMRVGVIESFEDSIGWFEKDV